MSRYRGDSLQKRVIRFLLWRKIFSFPWQEGIIIGLAGPQGKDALVVSALRKLHYNDDSGDTGINLYEKNKKAFRKCIEYHNGKYLDKNIGVIHGAKIFNEKAPFKPPQLAGFHLDLCGNTNPKNIHLFRCWYNALRPNHYGAVTLLKGRERGWVEGTSIRRYIDLEGSLSARCRLISRIALSAEQPGRLIEAWEYSSGVSPMMTLIFKKQSKKTFWKNQRGRSCQETSILAPKYLTASDEWAQKFLEKNRHLPGECFGYTPREWAAQKALMTIKQRREENAYSHYLVDV